MKRTTLILILALSACVHAQENSKQIKLRLLASQLRTNSEQLEQAQQQLAKTPNPNMCCCVGAFIVCPVIGGIFWYLVDVKPKQDKRHQIEVQIQTLTTEKQVLLAQVEALGL